MKKILLATTVLAATAGFAAAEVAVSGSARMGVISTLGSKAEFTSRVRIVFTGSGETDNGLSFGASMRADQSAGNGGTVTDSGGNTHANGTTGTTNGDSTVFISGAFGKLTMGDVGGAADSIVGQVSGVGLTGLGDMNEIGFIGTTKNAVLYTYSAGALTFGIGAGQTTAGNILTGAKQEYSIAAKYATDAYSVAIGYEDNSATNELSLLGSATFSGATVKAKYADNSGSANNSYALSVDYAMSGVNVTAFYSKNSNLVDNRAAYGVGASYDLGGGASVVGGIADKSGDGLGSSFDLGVSMSF